jgi:cellulose synthase (UDP-forming)
MVMGQPFQTPRGRWIIGCALWLWLCLCLPAIGQAGSDAYLQELNRLHELWHYYKYTHIEDGRVIARDEGNVTTSEGQSYALLRAVWSNDPLAFEAVYAWTRAHLAREDRLFAWRWQGGAVTDANAATDADTDIALALLLAAKRFDIPRYRQDALTLLDDIWKKEVVAVKGRHYITGGNWAPKERHPTIHVGYLAPYAYELFARVDHRHPWRELIASSYDILEWLYYEEQLAVPPQVVFIDKETGELMRKPSASRRASRFSYDAFPIFWRVAADARWHHRGKERLRKKMLAHFQTEWKRKGRFMDTYTLAGKALSKNEGQVLYATVHSLASLEDPDMAAAIEKEKLEPLWQAAIDGQPTPYYLHNWLWFDRALTAGVARNHLSFFDIFTPIDTHLVWTRSPWAPTAGAILLFALLQLPMGRWQRPLKVALLVCGLWVCTRYLWYRATQTLNYLEGAGPFISIALLCAEGYCLTSILLMVVQVGLTPDKRRSVKAAPDFSPAVDVFIPIYSESLEILAKTLAAATAMTYANKVVHVLDDSHREAVAELARQYGAHYIRGPRRHAKAGNLNHALGETAGDLIVVFDTDHIPVTAFLDHTVPPFSDPQVGVVQTPHHFYNPDIFQKAFRLEGRIPNEQDMFNHGIQGGRDHWQGAFFVGSGAVFRREALAAIGGFKLMSITEDIHSSQHLHGRGYRSVFVDRDLAVGLAAEDYRAYVVQRKRWMQGCLQIFFKDNPLFQKGLGLRHRVGYFASLWYFFFPVIRLIFWMTPLYYLLFHLHPLFADLSVLLAYLLPNMICLPLISAALLPGWPRFVWGSLYEVGVCFPLFFGLVGMLVPKKLGFKVTPKGITTERRRFDLRAAALTLAAAAITAIAIVKGIVEYNYFGIEKDAYVFNLGWAIFNLLLLAMALLVAWERPQRRCEARLKLALPFRLVNGKRTWEGVLTDIGLGGAGFRPAAGDLLPDRGELEIFPQRPLRLAVERVYDDGRRGIGRRCGWRFCHLSSEQRDDLLVRTFAQAGTWGKVHAGEPRSNIKMLCFLVRGLASSWRADRILRRGAPRRRCFKPRRAVCGGRTLKALVCNISLGGWQALMLSGHRPSGAQWHFMRPDGEIVAARNVYLRKRLPFIYQAGFVPWK